MVRAWAVIQSDRNGTGKVLYSAAVRDSCLQWVGEDVGQPSSWHFSTILSSQPESLLVRDSGGRAIVCETSRVVAACWISGNVWVAVEAEEGEEALPIAVDCRETLLACYGPNESEWIKNFSKVHAVVEPLLADAKVLLTSKEAGAETKSEWAFLSGLAFARIHRKEMFQSPNLAVCADPVEEEALLALEETMDLLEQCEETGNDTLDEADLCLSVGIACIDHGTVLRSSLCKEDLFDVYRVLVARGVYKAGGNVDVSDLYAVAIPLFACIENETGARLPLSNYSATDSSVSLERRVLNIVKLGQTILAHVLVSQHPEVFGTGHLDPYGSFAMERALQEMVSSGTLVQLEKQRLSRMDDLLDMIHQDKTERENRIMRHHHSSSSSTSSFSSLPSARPRSKSAEGTSLWSRLKRAGSGLSFRRQRSSSVDELPVELDDSEKVVKARLLLRAYLEELHFFYRSPEALTAIAYLYGATSLVLPPDIGYVKLVTNDPPAALPVNYLHFETACKEYLGCTLAQLDEEFGF